MNTANCTANKQKYTDEEFELLPAADKNKLRRHLVCRGCGAKAYFCGKSEHKAAHFGARPHEEDPNGGPCGYAGSSPGKGNGGEGATPPSWHGHTIYVDLTTETREPSDEDDKPDKRPNKKKKKQRKGKGGSKDNNKSNLKLNRILFLLLKNDDLQTSDAIIVPDGKTKYKAREFFVHTDEIADQHIDRFVGCWGKLSDARVSGGTLWLNTGSRDSLSICIEKEMISSLLIRFKLGSIKELSGSHFLAFGHIRQKLENGKVYLKPESLEHLALRRR